mgnify:CR=1 FL=1
MCSSDLVQHHQLRSEAAPIDVRQQSQQNALRAAGFVGRQYEECALGSRDDGVHVAALQADEAHVFGSARKDSPGSGLREREIPEVQVVLDVVHDQDRSIA